MVEWQKMFNRSARTCVIFNHLTSYQLLVLDI